MRALWAIVAVQRVRRFDDPENFLTSATCDLALSRVFSMCGRKVKLLSTETPGYFMAGLFAAEPDVEFDVSLCCPGGRPD